MKRLILVIAAAGLLGLGTWAQACSLGAWSASSGAVLDGGPGEANNIARLAGLCAMSASGAGYVQDNSPSGEGRIINSFYYRTTGTGNATLLVACQDEGCATPVFEVTTNGSMVTVTPNDGGTPASAPANAGFWNHVHIDWNAGDNILVHVNSDPTGPANATATSGNGASTIDAQRLGPVGGLGGFSLALFDQFESRRSLTVAGIVPGDANGNGSCTLGDAVAILNEFLTGLPGNNVGTPDRNLDGNISLGDAVQTLNAFLTAQC